MVAGDDVHEVEFFGVTLKVRNPRLAALLNSDVTEDVRVVGRRALDVLAGDDPGDGEEPGGGGSAGPGAAGGPDAAAGSGAAPDASGG